MSLAYLVVVGYHQPWRGLLLNAVDAVTIAAVVAVCVFALGIGVPWVPQPGCSSVDPAGIGG